MRRGEKKRKGKKKGEKRIAGGDDMRGGGEKAESRGRGGVEEKRRWIEAIRRRGERRPLKIQRGYGKVTCL